MNAGFIGAGKVGTVLGRYLAASGVSVSGYASLHRASAERAAARTGASGFSDVAELVSCSDVIFLTVPDAAIADAWSQMLRMCDLAGKTICHCSGCATSGVFEGAAAAGAHVCSAHPLFAFSDPLCPLDGVARAHITLEGDETALRSLEGLFAGAGNPVHRIDARDKVRYHAAAVFASNLVLAPLDAAVRLMDGIGISEPDALAALTPLIEGNARAFCECGAAAALTGPVERSDAATVAGHLDALDPLTAALYRQLSAALLGVARARHPGRDYSELETMIGERTA